jgi:hypothetical protein
MLDAITFLFLLSAFAAVVISEKITDRIVPAIFKKHLEEIEKEERQLAEYYEATTLAVILNDKEAYDGLQAVMNDIYSKIFFRKIAINSSVFFIVLSPYMLFAKYAFGSLPLPPVTTIFGIAIVYFAVKFVYYMALGMRSGKANL